MVIRREVTSKVLIDGGKALPYALGSCPMGGVVVCDFCAYYCAAILKKPA